MTSFRGSESTRVAAICAIGAALCLVAVVAACAVGSAHIPLRVTLGILGRGLGLNVEQTWTANQANMVLHGRLPRIVGAALVGAALALSGVVMQGLFRNPLASPGVLGVSAGGAFGAVLCIHLGLAARSLWSLPVCAFGGALAAIATVYLLATRHGQTPLATLILAGVAVTAFVGSATSLVLALAVHFDEELGKQIVLWTMGGLDDCRWEHVLVAAPPIGLAASAAMLFLRDLNIMLLGEEQAQALGVSAQRLKISVLLLASVATGAAVAISGPIAFVGLVIPHLLRLVLGPDHRTLAPACLFAGAFFLVAADTFVRCLPPSQIRLGIVTGLVGAPFFIVLLVRYRQKAIHL